MSFFGSLLTKMQETNLQKISEIQLWQLIGKFEQILCSPMVESAAEKSALINVREEDLLPKNVVLAII